MDISKRIPRTKLTQKALLQCGISVDAAQITADEIYEIISRYPDAENVLRDYLNNFEKRIKQNKWLYICGKPKIGSDLVAGYIAKFAYSRNMSVRRISCFDMMDLYYHRMEARDEDEKSDLRDKFEQTIRDIEFLVLTNVDVGLYAKNSERVVYNMLEKRADNGLPTVLTSKKTSRTLITDSAVRDEFIHLRETRFIGLNLLKNDDGEDEYD